MLGTARWTVYVGPIMPRRPLLGSGLTARRVHVRPQDVVFVKGLFEASEGLGVLFAERGGELVLAAPNSRAKEFEELLRDLESDVGAVVVDESARF